MTLFIGIAVFLIWAILPVFTYPIYLNQKIKKQKEPNLTAHKFSDPQNLLNQFSQSHPGQFIFSRLNLKNEEIKTIPVNQAEKEKFKLNLDKFFKDKKQKDDQATTKDLLIFLINNFTPFTEFLEKKRVTSDDFISVYEWYYRQTNLLGKRTGFWQLENLLKIPPLGESLVYGYTPNLNRYCLDLGQPKIYSHHLVGRTRETTQIEQVLSRASGNNVLLVGEPGVGRHTIIEEFAKKSKEGKVNPVLAHKRILEFGIRRLLSESKSIMKAKGLVEEILAEAAYAGNIVLVIENFSRYVSVGPGRVDLTAILNKAVIAGVQIIGVTTFSDFAKYLYPNQELLKHFEKVEASPPTNQEALTILEDTVPLYEKRNKVFVTYQALKEIIEKVDKYIVHIPFPEKAIDLLDETCVYAAQKQKFLVTPQEINQVISEKTKIPLGKISQEEVEKLQNLENIIHQRIVNQEKAVTAIAKAMRRTRAGITKEGKPIGSFLFMGPTGVGKTATAKALAESYFGSEDRMLRFDMSEYQGNETIERIIGSTKTNEPGLFTKKIRENPFSLLLLDEIEKTHPNILNLFLTMLDEGYFTDVFGKKVDCRNLIIIGTSNAGTELIRQKLKSTPVNDLEKLVIDYVQKEGIFSPEFINRFDAVVIFQPLNHEHLLKIAKLMLEDLNKRLKKKEVSVKITDQLLKRIVHLGFDPAFGARPMNRVIQDKVEDQLAQKFLRGELKKGEEVEIKI